MTKRKASKPLPDKGCYNCSHWAEDTEPGQDRNGSCRRYPPTLVYDSDDGAMSLWPWTSADDICGEHSVKLQ